MHGSTLNVYTHVPRDIVSTVGNRGQSESFVIRVAFMKQRR